MSVLDTFYILFKTSAKEATKEVEDLDKAAVKTAADVDKIGKGGAPTAVKAINAEMNSAADASQRLSRSAVNFGEALIAPVLALASIGALTSLALARVNDVVKIGQEADKLQISAQDYDAFTRSVRASGGTINGAAGALGNLSAKINEAASNAKSGAAKDFKSWGLAITDIHGKALGATQGMVALAGNLEKVSSAEALARIKKLGINDAATIQLLLKGKEAVQAKMDAEKAAGVVTENQIRVAQEYQAEVGETTNVLESFGNHIMEMVLPAVTALYRQFREVFTWLINHKVLVEGFFIGIAAAVTTYFLPAMARAAVAVIAATWPFLAIAAAVTAVAVAFALLYEDIVAFMTGAPSEIGVLAEKYKWFGIVVKGIGEAFKIMKEAASVALEAIGTLAAEVWSGLVAAGKWVADEYVGYWGVILDAGRRFFDTMKPLWEAFGRAAELAKEVATRAMDAIGGDIARLIPVWEQNFEDLKASAVRVFNALYEDISPLIDKIKQAAEIIKNAFTSAFDAIAAAWRATIGAIADGINTAIDKLRILYGMGGAQAPTPGGDAGTQMGALGSRLLGGASSTPLGATTPGNVGGVPANVNSTKTNTVNVGGVTINAAGADANEISAHIDEAIKSRIRDTVNNFDDGVDR